LVREQPINAACGEPIPPAAAFDRFPEGDDQACQTVCGADLLRWRRTQLDQGGRSVDLDWLLREEAGLDWATLQRLRIDPGRSVSLRTGFAHLERLWRRHCLHHEPLQYLVGRCPWRDLELDVAPGVLIPRQETEQLLELAQDCGGTDPPRCWADLGTGSGCLAVAMARLWPDAVGFGVDRSALALRQAQRNLQRWTPGRQVHLLAGDWWAPLQSWWGSLEMVVTNPPYIPTHTWAALEPVVQRHEPRLALDGGADGLAAIRLIVRDAPRALAPGGWLLLEHHHDQSAAVQQLLHSAGLQQISAHRDLGGNWRFVVGRRAGGGLAPSVCLTRPASRHG